MKTLIVYYSLTTNNELLAKELQARLSCDILKIQEHRKRNKFTVFLDLVFKRKPKLKPHGFSIGEYDHLVLIAPIWAGKIASPLRSFLEDEKSHINRYSFITVCGGVAGQKEKITNELAALINQKPKSVMELWVSKLLPVPNNGLVEFRLSQKDIVSFRKEVDEFLVANESFTEVTRKSKALSL